MKNLKLTIAILVSMYGSSYCQNPQKALEHAGANKGVFEAVLEHYKDEPEKYRAALFLIEHIELHRSVDYLWYENDSLIHFSEFDYPDYKLAFNDLRTRSKTSRIRPKKRIRPDTEHVTTELLIENIDLAFSEWKNNPWSTSYPFETFCEYILPYRNLIEPLENWRKELKALTKTGYVKGNETDPVDVCSKVISGLKDFTFVNKRPDPTPILSANQMLFRRQGSCPDLANFAVLVSRSIGVATTFDFTPHYAASSNRHFWSTVIDTTGKHIPFNSNSVSECEDCLPYLYNANRKRLGKVFRKTYSGQKMALAHLLSPAHIPEAFLKDKNIIDVTHEYVEVSNVHIDSSHFKDTIAYLNVFNLSKWKTIDWGKLESDEMVFKNIGRDIVYLPSIYKNGRMEYSKYPFILTKEGNVHHLKPDTLNTQNVLLSRENEVKNTFIDFNTSEILENNTYNLYYWSNGWNKVGTSTAKEIGVHYSNVPTNALFLLTPKKADRFERIFIIEPKTNQIIWY